MLLRTALRYLLRHPWQAGLCILGVALGVAMIVSIDLSNNSARRAFTLSTEAVAGRATHQIVGGPAGMDEAIYHQLRMDLNLRTSAPVVEGYVSSPQMEGITLHLLGIDPFAEPPFRSYLATNETASPSASPLASSPSFDLSRLLLEPSTVLLAATTARRYNLQTGDTLTLRIGSRLQTATIVGLIQPQDTLSEQVLETMLITDIASAQEMLNMVGKLSRIDLILAEQPVPPPAQPSARPEAPPISVQTIEQALPPGVMLTRPESRTSTLEQMTRAFELNLSALSLLALIVGIFLIYNTMTFSVVQRRELLGILRCVGVTRRQIFFMVMVEALVISLLGSLAGVGLGIILGRGLVQLVTRTINDLYFVVTIRSLMIDPLILLKGMSIGILATLAAAAIPAREATLAPPRAAIQRSTIEDRIRRIVPTAAVIGTFLLIVAVFLLFAQDIQLWLSGATQGNTTLRNPLMTTVNLRLAFVALFGILIGVALLTPGITTLLMTMLQPLWGKMFGLIGRMAARGVVATLSRTSIAIAALMIAVSVTIGVGTMVQSFRQTVVNWLDQSLAADIYISPPTNMATRVDTTLDRTLIEELLQTPGIAGRTFIRSVEVQAPGGPTPLLAIDRDRNYGMRALRFKGNQDMHELADQFDQGDIFISEPLAYRTGLQPGDTLPLQTDRGENAFRIAGIYYDYTSDRGVIQMAYPTYQTYWDDTAITSCAIYTRNGVNVEDMVTTLREQVDGRQELLIRSYATLRQNSLEIFDRTFAITGVLQILATIVAFIGILSALMALQLERTRELGMLRALGLTPPQLWQLLLSQTSLMGLTAGILSLPVGFVLALILIFIINRRSFGWTLDMVIDPRLFIQAMLLAVIAALLAGIYPSWRIGRISPSVALREE
jgi:putative ABC transport system permease protein